MQTDAKRTPLDQARASSNHHGHYDERKDRRVDLEVPVEECPDKRRDTSQRRTVDEVVPENNVVRFVELLQLWQELRVAGRIPRHIRQPDVLRQLGPAEVPRELQK